MMLNLIHPWETEMLFGGGGLLRSVSSSFNNSRFCRPHPCQASAGPMSSPRPRFQRQESRRPFDDWLAVRMNRRLNYGGFERPPCAAATAADRDLDRLHRNTREGLDSVLDRFCDALTLDKCHRSHPQQKPQQHPTCNKSSGRQHPTAASAADAATSSTTAANVNADDNVNNSNMVTTELRMPGRLRSTNDLIIELDDDSAALQVRAVCADRSSLSGFSVWQVSLQLDNSLDFGRLEAAYDPERDTVELKAPRRSPRTAPPKVQPVFDENNNNVSSNKNAKHATAVPTATLEACTPPVIGDDEDRQESRCTPPPASVIQDTTIAADRPKEQPSSESDVPTATQSLPHKLAPHNTGSPVLEMEIEDVGPDEECDRVSTTSSESQPIDEIIVDTREKMNKKCDLKTATKILQK